MRIRRKKHLLERLDELKNYIMVLDESIKNVNEAIKVKSYLDYNSIFGNDNPLELEIGCGKGNFISTIASNNKVTNFIAVEMLQNIVVMAAEKVKDKGLKNVIFFNSGAEYLPRYIKDDSISNIYLNFSPPFPKDGQESKRLTSKRFVNYYKDFLIKGGKVYQKTDDKDFFEYSKNSFMENGFEVSDLTKEYNEDKISSTLTEYEEKFKNLGMKIYYLEAKKI